MQQERDFMEEERNFARQNPELRDSLDYSNLPPANVGPAPTQDPGPIRENFGGTAAQEMPEGLGIGQSRA
jgi:hypothetical protein